MDYFLERHSVNVFYMIPSAVPAADVRPTDAEISGTDMMKYVGGDRLRAGRPAFVE